MRKFPMCSPITDVPGREIAGGSRRPGQISRRPPDGKRFRTTTGTAEPAALTAGIELT